MNKNIIQTVFILVILTNNDNNSKENVQHDKTKLMIIIFFFPYHLHKLESYYLTITLHLCIISKLYHLVGMYITYIYKSIFIGFPR